MIYSKIDEVGTYSGVLQHPPLNPPAAKFAPPSQGGAHMRTDA